MHRHCIARHGAAKKANSGRSTLLTSSIVQLRVCTSGREVTHRLLAVLDLALAFCHITFRLPLFENPPNYIAPSNIPIELHSTMSLSLNSSLSTAISSVTQTPSVTRTSYIYPSVTTGTYICDSNSAETSLDNITGLSGEVCQFNYNPIYFTIDSCCKNSSDVRMDDQCKQYCEVSDNSTFSLCLNREFKSKLNRTRTGITLCRNLDKKGGMFHPF